ARKASPSIPLTFFLLIGFAVLERASFALSLSRCRGIDALLVRFLQSWHLAYCSFEYGTSMAQAFENLQLRRGKEVSTSRGCSTQLRRYPGMKPTVGAREGVHSCMRRSLPRRTKQACAR